MKLLRAGLLALSTAALCSCAGMNDIVQRAKQKAGAGDVFTPEHMQSAFKTAKAFRKSAEEISESEEYYIGRAVAANILGKYKPLRDAALNSYVQKVAQSVALASDRPSTFKGYHVQLLDTDEINAFAAPGGFIFVTRGMLNLAKDEDELACVLAHEVGHVARKHGLKAIQSARLTQAFATLGTEVAKSYTPAEISQLTSAFEGVIEDVVKNLVSNGYSRSKEFEADDVAVEFARDAGYNPAGLKAFLTRMDKASSAKGGMFKTHPAASDRIDKLGSLSPGSSYRKSPERSRRFSAAGLGA